MLYVYYGTNKEKARTKVRTTIDSLLSKNSDAIYFRITPQNAEEFNFEELTQSLALFKSEYIVFLDSLFASKEGEEKVLKHIKAIASAPHPFFLLDGELKSPIIKKLEKYADKITVFNETKTAQKESFNMFALTDALGGKQIKNTWLLFEEARRSGASMENVHGTLFWLFKSMVLASTQKNAESAGMKEFPFKKSRTFANTYWSEQELREKMTECALLPIVARKSGNDLGDVLERFILSIKR